MRGLGLTASPETLATQIDAVFEVAGAVRRLDGSRMLTTPELFAEFARRLDFPGYFGHNWSALEDCLANLEWLSAPAYLLVIDGAEHVLDEAEPEDLAVFGGVLQRAAQVWSEPVEKGEWWDRPGMDFGVLLHSSTEAGAAAVRSRWEAVGIELSEPAEPDAPADPTELLDP